MARTGRKLHLLLAAALTLCMGLAFASTAWAASDSPTADVTDQVERGGLTIYKYDLETGKSEPQGGADFVGGSAADAVQFTIRNDSTHAIVYRYNNNGGAEYHSQTYLPGETWQIPVVKQSDGTYIAKTRADALPYGTYRVWESSPGTQGYNLLNTVSQDDYELALPSYVREAGADQWSNFDARHATLDKGAGDVATPGYTFTISKDGQQVVFTGADQSTEVKTSDASGANYTAGPGNLNYVKRYGLKVQKYDADRGTNGASAAQGEASLQGAIFNLYSNNSHDVIVRKADGSIDTRFGDNGVVSKGGLVGSGMSADNFADVVQNGGLPMGQYILVEVKAPEGYLLSGNPSAAAVSVSEGLTETTAIQGAYRNLSTLWAAGYDKFSSVTVNLNDNATTNGVALVTFGDVVKRGGVQIIVRDYDFKAQSQSDITPQGDGRFANAKIDIYNDSKQSVYMKDTRETIEPGGKIRTITTDENGVAELKGLPYGKYHAVHSDPSLGYNLTGEDEWYYEFEIADSPLGKCTADGNVIVTKSTIKTTESGLGDTPAANAKQNRSENTGKSPAALKADDANLYEHIIRHGMLNDGPKGAGAASGNTEEVLGTKVDDESGSAVAQGSASMVGTQVTIRNLSDYAIMWKDVTTPSEQFYHDRTWTKRFAKNADVVTLTYVGIDANGNVVLGEDGTPNKANPLAWKYKPEHDIEVTADEQAAKNIMQYVWRVEVKMADGKVAYERLTGLPYGTYNIRETKAGKGYVLNTTWEKTFSLHNDQDGRFDASTLLGTDAWTETIYHTGIEGGEIPASIFDGLTNEPQRIDVGWSKLGPDGRPLAGVAFKITSKSTGESHIVVSDLNGRIDTRSWQANDSHDSTDPYIFMHNRFTNASDAAYDGSAVDSAKLYWQHGYWFYGYPDHVYGQFGQTYGFDNPAALCKAINDGDFAIPTDPADPTGFAYEFNNRGALPYDVYEIEELRSDANRGMELIEKFDFYAIEACHGSNNGYIDLGTLTNGSYDPSTGEPTIVPVTGDDRMFVEKQASPADNSTVSGNSEITYTLKYENDYVDTLADAVIRDYIPVGTTFKSATGDDYAYVEATDTTPAYVEWSLGSLAKGATGSVTVTVTVDRNPAKPLIANQARYQSLDYDFTAGEFDSEPFASTNVVRHSTDGTTTPTSLTAVKTATPATGNGVERGGIVTYEVKVTNTGATKADNVAVFDYVPYNSHIATSDNGRGYNVPVVSTGGRVVNNGIGWQLGTLEPGASKTVSFAVKVDDNAYGIVSNSATFGTAYGVPMTPLPNTSNTTNNMVGLSTDVVVTKTADPDKVSAGNPVTYTITVENTGAANVDNLTVTDAIPANTTYIEGSASDGGFSPQYADGTLTWTIPSLLHDGGKATMTFQVMLDRGVSENADIANVAVVTDDDGNEWRSNSTSSTTYDAAKDMAVTKSADPVDGSYVTPGQQIVYTIDWTNNGSNTVKGFAVRDAIPAGTHFIDGSLVLVEDGQSSADAVQGEHDSTQIRTGNSTEEGTFDEGAAIIGGKYSVTLPDPDAVYTFVMAEDWTVENLTQSADKSVPARNDVRAYLYDDARVPGDWIEFESTNAHAYNYLWHATVLDSGQIRLHMCVLTPTDTNLAMVDGGKANYDAAGNAVTALIDRIEPGESGSLSFIVEVNDDCEFNFDIDNVATYAAGIYNLGTVVADLPSSTNTTRHIVGEARFGIDPGSATKTVDKTTAKRGDIVTYTVAVTNTGTAYAKDVSIGDELVDNGVKHIMYVPGSYRVSGGDSASASADIAASLRRDSDYIEARATQLAPGETLTLSFQAELTDVVDGDVVHNVATYGDLGGQDMITEACDVTIATPSLRIVKEASPADGTPVMAGDIITYTLKVANDSDIAASGVAVYDQIPTHTSIVGEHAGLNVVRNALVADKIELAPGEEKTFTFKVKVDPAAELDTIVTNRATVGYADAPAWPLEIDSNEVSHNVVSYEKKNDLSLPAASDGLYAEKFAGVVTIDGDTSSVDFTDNVAAPGSKVVYRVDYTNTSTDLVPSGIVRDYLPEGLTVASEGAGDEFAQPISEGGVYVSAEDSANGRAYVEWTFGQVLPGEVGSVYVVCDVADEPHSILPNQARYETTDAQRTAGDPANAEPVGRTNVSYVKTDPNAVTPAAVSAVKTSDPAAGTTVKVGDKVTYTVTVRNGGDTTATGIGVYDTIPAGTVLSTVADGDGYDQPAISNGGKRIGDSGVAWVVNQLASGESTSVSFTVEVVDAAAFSVENKATFATGVGDVAGPLPGITNVSGQAVEHVSDLTIEKTADPEGTPEAPGKVAPGEIVTYTITVTNNGNGNSEEVEVFDALPEGMQLVGGSMTGGSRQVEPTADDKYMHWTIPTIAHDGGVATLTFQARVKSDVEAGKIMENQASLGERWVDASYEGWHYDIAPMQSKGYVFGERAMADESTHNKVIEMEPGYYQVTSDENMRTVIMVNTYDGAFNQTGKRIYTIQPGQTANVRIPLSGEMYISTTEVHDTPAGHFERAVYDSEVVHFDVPDFEDVPTMQLSNKTGHIVEAEADGITTLKSANPPSGSYVKPGDTIFYTIDFENTSDRPVSNVAVRDAIPEHTTFVEGSISVTGNDGKSTTDLKDEYDKWVEDNAWWNDVQPDTPEQVVWYPSDPVGKADPEGLYNAVVVDPEHQMFPQWDEVRQWLSTANAGDAIEFTIENDNFYNSKWIAIVQSDGYVRLFHSVIVPNAEDGANYSEAHGIYGNYDARDKAVYAKADILYPGDKCSVTFAVTVDADAPANFEIVNSYTFGSYIEGLPSGDLPRVGADTTTHIVGAAGVTVPEDGLAKSVSPTGDVRPGDELTYTITLVNSGDAYEENVAIYDELWQSNVKGVTYVPGSYQVTGGDSAQVMADYAASLDATTKTVVAKANRLNPGEELTLTFKVKVEDAVEGDVITNKATWGVDTGDGLPTAALSNETNTVSNNVIRDVRPSDVTVVKTQDRADGERVTPGDEITYTVTATNNGETKATNVGIYDAIPAGTVYVDNSLSAEGVEAAYTDGAVTGTIAELAGGASVTITFKVRVAGGFAGGIVNQASWDYDVTAAPTAPLNRLTNDVDVISVPPTLNIVKKQDPANGAEVAGGDILTYSITISNPGPVKAYYVGMYDWAPEGTHYVDGSFTCDKGQTYVAEDGLLTAIVGDLAKGEKATMTFQVEVDFDYVGTIRNRALWVSPAANPETLGVDDVNNGLVHMYDMSDPTGAISNPRTSSPAGMVLVRPMTAVTIPIPDGSTTGWSNDPSDPNDTTGSNTGDNQGNNDQASGDQGNTDNTGGNEGSTSGSSNETTAHVGGNTPSDQGSGEGDNTTPSGDQPAAGDNDGTPTETGDGTSDIDDIDDKGGSNEVVANVTKPTVLLTKTANVADGSYVKAGDEIEFKVVASNIGANNANKIVVSDVVPTGMTYVENSVSDGATYENGKVWATKSLAPGESFEFTFKAKVNADYNGVIENVAKFEQNSDAKPTDDPKGGVSNKVTLHAEEPSIELIKTSSVADGSYVAAGTEVTYTVKATNKGEAATEIDMFDTVPTGMTLVEGSIKGATLDKDAIVTTANLEPGKSAEFSFKATVNATDEPLDIVNTAAWKLKDSTSEGKPSNEVLLHVGLPGISIVKTSDPADGSLVGNGDEVTYNVVVTNTGTVLGEVAVKDIMPKGMELVEGSASEGITVDENGDLNWSGNVEAGESVTLTYKAVVKADATGELRNTATATVKGIATPASATGTLTVAPADFKVSKTSDPASGSFVANGDEVTYTITVANEGKGAGTAEVSDTLPAGLTYVDGSVSDNASYADGKISASIHLAAGESATVTYKGTVNATAGDEIANSVKVVDPATETEADATSTVKVGQADWKLAKTIVTPEADENGKHTVKPGDTVKYQISVENTGTIAGKATLADAIPSALKLVDEAAGSDAQDGSTADYTVDENGVISANVELMAGMKYTIEYTTQVKEEAEADDVTNTATLTAPELEKDLESSATLTVDAGTAPAPASEGYTVTKKATGVMNSNHEAYKDVNYSQADGDIITYAIEVDNSKNAEAATVTVKDTPGKGLAFADLAAKDSDGTTVNVIDGVDSKGNVTSSFKVKTNVPGSKTETKTETSNGLIDDSKVFIRDLGNKYHASKNCSDIPEGATDVKEVTLKEAKAANHTEPCSACVKTTKTDKTTTKLVADGSVSISFDVDVAAGDRKTLYVQCVTVGAEKTNVENVLTYKDINGKDQTAKAPVSYKTPDTNKSENKGSLPETGQTIAVVLLIAAGLTVLSLAGAWFVRRRRDGTWLYR